MSMLQDMLRRGRHFEDVKGIHVVFSPGEHPDTTEMEDYFTKYLGIPVNVRLKEHNPDESWITAVTPEGHSESYWRKQVYSMLRVLMPRLQDGSRSYDLVGELDEMPER